MIVITEKLFSDQFKRLRTDFLKFSSSICVLSSSIGALIKGSMILAQCFFNFSNNLNLLIFPELRVFSVFERYLVFFFKINPLSVSGMHYSTRVLFLLSKKS